MDIETKRHTTDSLGKKLKVFNAEPPKSAFEIGMKSAADIIHHKETNLYKPAAFLQHRLMMQRQNSSTASQYYALNH